LTVHLRFACRHGKAEVVVDTPNETTTSHGCKFPCANHTGIGFGARWRAVGLTRRLSEANVVVGTTGTSHWRVAKLAGSVRIRCRAGLAQSHWGAKGQEKEGAR